MNSFGLYIHVPFCRTKCSYCGFYRVTEIGLRERYVESIIKELELNGRDFLKKDIRTIYVGGGTPSILTGEELRKIIEEGVKRHWSLNKVEEFTVEVNPDDVTTEYLRELKNIGVNRISMGVQCLEDSILKTINRRHTSKIARDAVKMIKSEFDNVSLDYIYGLPGQNIEIVSRDIEEMLNMGVQHLSAYALSVEEGSILEKQIEKGLVALPDEDMVLEQYDVIIELMKKYGWRHYEVSNYACDDEHVAKHNSSYWDKRPYLGVGPAASSYDGENRRWTNVENVSNYVKGVYDIEEDILNEEDLLNEKIMLGLRTDRGVDISEFDEKMQKRFKDNTDIIVDNGRYKITEKGWMIYNRIVSSLFV